MTDRAERISSRRVRVEWHILRHATEKSPHQLLRGTSSRTRGSHDSVVVLHQQLLCPCELQVRLVLSQWFPQRFREDVFFFSSRILFTDRADFTRNGVTNVETFKFGVKLTSTVLVNLIQRSAEELTFGPVQMQAVSKKHRFASQTQWHCLPPLLQHSFEGALNTVQLHTR